MSWINGLLVPFAIWKFGWVDGLPIDSTMKGFWAKVGKADGSGGNPREYAIKGILSTMELRLLLLKLRDKKQMREVHWIFVVVASIPVSRCSHARC